MELTELRLAHAALLIAKDANPKISVLKYLRRIDVMGQDIRARVSPGLECVAAPSRVRLDAILYYLYSELKFQGNSLDYLDPKNNFLNEVIDRRLGIPSTLSIVLIDLCFQLGLRATGIELPRDFVVSVEMDAGAPVIVDPFNGGRILDSIEIQAWMRSEHWRAQHALDNRAILTRLLADLKHSYWSFKQFDKALPVLERLLELNPQNISEFRDRGLAYYETGRFPHALLDLERYMLEMTRSLEKMRSGANVGMAPLPTEALKEFFNERFWLEEMVHRLRVRVPSSPLLH